mgnify:CR=1 FL=1
MTGSKGSKVFSLIVIVLTIAMVCVLAFSNEELVNAGDALRSLRPGALLGCVLCFLGYAVFDGVGLFAFLRRQGYPIKLSSSIHLSFTGLYYANITPSSSGGQPMQVYLLNQRGVPVGVSSSALSVRLMANQLMIVLMTAGLWIANGGFIQQQLGGVKGIVLLGLVINGAAVPLLLAVTFFQNAVQKCGAWIVHLLARWRWIKQEEKMLTKLTAILNNYHASVRLCLRQPGQLLLQLLLSGLQMLSLMFIPVCVYHAFGQSGASDSELLAVALMLFVSASYTPLPGASGAQEGVFALYFANIFPDGIRFMALLLWRFFTYYISLILGAIVTVVKGFHPDKKVKQEQAREGT